MMYQVIKFFTDLQDGNHKYEVGDTFPRPGLEVSAERLAELSGSRNKQGMPLIAEIPEPETTAPAEETEEATDDEKPKRKRKAD